MYNYFFLQWLHRMPTHYCVALLQNTLTLLESMMLLLFLHLFYKLHFFIELLLLAFKHRIMFANANTTGTSLTSCRVWTLVYFLIGA